VGKVNIKTEWNFEPIYVQFLYHPDRRVNPNFYQQTLELLRANPRFKRESKLFFLCCCGNRSVNTSRVNFIKITKDIF
jgi:hypothetical protein